MHYYTIDWYHESQITNWFAHLKNAEEQGTSFNNHTRDNHATLESHPQSHKNIVDQDIKKKALKKYLPEYLLTYYDEMIEILFHEKYPRLELKNKINQWLTDVELKNKENYDKYKNFYYVARDQLPHTVIEHLKMGTFHDSVVMAIKKPSPDKMTIIMDCEGGLRDKLYSNIRFIGVKDFTSIDKLVGSLWLYNEISPTDSGFLLEVLFEYETEVFIFKIEAELLEIENYDELKPNTEI